MLPAPVVETVEEFSPRSARNLQIQQELEAAGYEPVRVLGFPCNQFLRQTPGAPLTLSPPPKTLARPLPCASRSPLAAPHVSITLPQRA